MSDMPVLSVCVPTYNRLSYLKELLSALLSQANSVPNGLVEVCVGDNASTDGTRAYLETLTSPSLRFWTNPTNVGGDRNFLKCITEAHGDYVWLLGDDDLLTDDAVARVLTFLKTHHPALLISSADENEVPRLYDDYRSAVDGRPVRFPLAHTLISSNVFRRSLFDFGYAERTLKYNYAHMFGFMCRLSNRSVGVMPAFVRMRPVRAVFAKYPSCLCVKQAVYLRWLIRRFGLPRRYAWFAIQLALNLPIEYASRVKNWMIGRAGAC